MAYGLHGAFVLILAEEEPKRVPEAVCWAKENAMGLHMLNWIAILTVVQVTFYVSLI